MRLVLLFSFVLISQTFAFENSSYRAIKAKFESSQSRAQSFVDYAGSWTPNVLAVGTVENSIVLGHIDARTGVNYFHGVLDGVKFYNQIQITADEAIFWMDGYLYNIFKPQNKVKYSMDVNASNRFSFNSTWNDKITNSALRNVYSLSNTEMKNYRSLLKAEKGVVAINQSCKLISDKQMICQQKLSQAENNSRIESLDRYLVFDKL